MGNNVEQRSYMGLCNIYYTCKGALAGITGLSVTNVNSAGEKRLENWPVCKQALEVLTGVDFISEDAKKAYNALSVFDRENLIPIIDPKTYDVFCVALKTLTNKLMAVVDLYEFMWNGTSGPAVNIKIPQCKSLREYIDILEDINFIFGQCPYLRCKDEELRYSGTDVCSDCVTFTLIGAGVASGTFYILNNLEALIGKAIALKSNKKVLDMQDEMLKTMQLRNETAQDAFKVFKTMKSLTYKKYVNELKDEIGPAADGEWEDKVGKTLEKLSGLLCKGVEIYTSIETPKEIKVLFPFSDSQEAVPDNLMKYLEDKVSSGADDGQ